MVRETTTLGDGRAASSFRPQDIQVPNVVVWESTRQVTNAELASIAEKVAAQPEAQWRLKKQFEPLYGEHGEHRIRNMENYSTHSLPADALYTILLLWRRKQPNGLGEIRKVARLLSDNGYQQVAESLQP